MQSSRTTDHPTIRHGQGSTPLGPILLAFTEKGLCALRLLDRKTAAAELSALARDFPGVSLVEDPLAAQEYVQEINDVLSGRLAAAKVKLDMKGTPFQKRVWQALLRVPRGSTWSYSELARKIGKPRAVRAVASACAKNPVGLVVPCHRILRNDGSLGGYYWGPERKREILRSEKVKV